MGFWRWVLGAYWARYRHGRCRSRKGWVRCWRTRGHGMLHEGAGLKLWRAPARWLCGDDEAEMRMKLERAVTLLEMASDELPEPKGRKSALASMVDGYLSSLSELAAGEAK